MKYFKQSDAPKNRFILKDNVSAVAYSKMNNATVKKLWNSFCFTESSLSLTSCDDFIFKIGDIKAPILPEGKEYALSVNENGIAIVGRDYGCLMRGFMALVMKIEYDETSIYISHTNTESHYTIKNRMLHICIFPQNDLYFVKKLIRFAALCQYTHIVIEFWGMLKFDCLKELAWPHAFTKDEAREIINECCELGIEAIPMFNQLGHAAGTRMRYGKHVVLDQNPKLQRLFTPDGWVWNIESDEVAELHKKIRAELYELYPNTKYIHLGCDEAHYIKDCTRLRKLLPEFLEKLTTETEKEGRTPMIWADMLLEDNVYRDCSGRGTPEEVAELRSRTAPSTVLVDWQYDCYEGPIESSIALKNCGRPIMCAPWYEKKNYMAHIETAKEYDLFGVMFTTWHTLNENMPSILSFAQNCGADTSAWSEYSWELPETAALIRRISFEGSDYINAGWGKQEIKL